MVHEVALYSSLSFLMLPAVASSLHDVRSFYNFHNIKYVLLYSENAYCDQLYNQRESHKLFVESIASNNSQLFNVFHNKNLHHKNFQPKYYSFSSSEKMARLGDKIYRFAKRKIVKAIGREVERFLSATSKRKVSARNKKSFYITFNQIDF